MMSREESIARIEAVFNAASDRFDAPALSFWSLFGQQTVDRLSLSSGDHVLDVCCGTGASALPAAVSVGPTGQVLGIDLAESLLDLARNKSHQQGLNNIEFRYGDFENLKFPDESFDAIICVFGIFFVPDMTAAIRELWRMLRPNGKLAITSWGERIFEPANRMFWTAVEAERPDLVNTTMPWEQIGNPAELQVLLEAGGATRIDIFSEAVTHDLSSPEDWWTMVLGGGYRGIIDQFEPAGKERLRQASLNFLQTNNVNALNVDVLYAVAQKERY